MRAIIQRVAKAEVRVDGQVVGKIGPGWLVLLGVAKGDSDADGDWLSEKMIGLRAFADAEGKMNRDVREIGGTILVVSQFTLMADCRQGRRPSFTDAASPEDAERLYERFAAKCRELGIGVETGVFRADMQVELVNDGPVTFILDSRNAF